MTNLRLLSPKEWCNGKVQRRANPSECVKFYATWHGHGGLLFARCVHNARESTCILEASQPLSASPDACTLLASRTNLRLLSPKEWCNDKGKRRADPSECVKFYATWHGSGGL